MRAELLVGEKGAEAIAEARSTAIGSLGASLARHVGDPVPGGLG